MELRARFDEQNNIRWAERMEEAGCTLLYGSEALKVHSKICLITRRTKARESNISPKLVRATTTKRPPNSIPTYPS